MAHVFIVNNQTFNTHLKYLFAGTGNDKKTDLFYITETDKFNSDKGYEQKDTYTDGNSYTMLADINRVRIGDDVLFYNCSTHKFYGIFEIASKPFFEDVKDNCLFDELGKNLTFRVLIKPKEVFSKGLLETDALDSIKDIDKPYELCWSLIYRKLLGERGCAYITPYELDKLRNLLLKNNNNLTCFNSLSFDETSEEIVSSNLQQVTYNSNNISPDIFSRIKARKNRKFSFESHLQAYLLSNIENLDILPISPTTVPISWIGNEVYCSMGGKRIDLLIIQENQTDVYMNIVELKDEPCKVDIFEQLDYYIKWCSEFIAPNYKNKKNHIFGIGFGLKYNRKTKSYKDLVSTLQIKNNSLCEKYYIKEYVLDMNNNLLIINDII